MKRQDVYALFEKMISVAENELVGYTKAAELSVDKKADKSVVTSCDKRIDKKLSDIAVSAGFQVVSEEGEHVLDIVKSGNYVTIDPIDGTLGYVDYVNYAIENGGLQNFLQKDLGPLSDFCLLIGVVVDSVPRFGCCYNFITKEKILIDGEDKNSLVRENNVRNYSGENAVYVDQRLGGMLEKELVSMPHTTVIKQAALGLKSLYTIINPHSSAITLHTVQSAGLWDILPAAVAARAMGADVYDADGNPLKLNEYIVLPGTGAVIVKGELFSFILNRIRMMR